MYSRARPSFVERAAEDMTADMAACAKRVGGARRYAHGTGDNTKEMFDTIPAIPLEHDDECCEVFVESFLVLWFSRFFNIHETSACRAIAYAAGRIAEHEDVPRHEAMLKIFYAVKGKRYFRQTSPNSSAEREVVDRTIDLVALVLEQHARCAVENLAPVAMAEGGGSIFHVGALPAAEPGSKFLRLLRDLSGEGYLAMHHPDMRAARAEQTLLRRLFQFFATTAPGWRLCARLGDNIYRRIDFDYRKNPCFLGNTFLGAAFRALHAIDPGEEKEDEPLFVRVKS